MDLKTTPYSNLKIFAHPEKLDALQRGERTAPVYVRIKPTNICNHHCYYCSYADEELALRDSVNLRDQIEWKKLLEIIEDLSEMGVKAVTFSGGGEPLVYPRIVSAMQEVLAKKIDLSIITNGQLLSGERAAILSQAKWVRISLDAADRETYARIRRIPLESFEIILDNIRRFSLMKSPHCELGINFVVNHENADQIYQAAKLVYELGVNHIKFTARVTKDLEEYHQPFKENAIEQIYRAEQDFQRSGFKIINKYEDDFQYCMVSKRCYSFCGIKEIFTVIAADSKVYFCHDKAYVKAGIVGDLKPQSFRELWFSPETEERYRTFNARKECEHHCVYDDRNILINSFLALDKNHINFL